MNWFRLISTVIAIALAMLTGSNINDLADLLSQSDVPGAPTASPTDWLMTLLSGGGAVGFLVPVLKDVIRQFFDKAKDGITAGEGVEMTSLSALLILCAQRGDQVGIDQVTALIKHFSARPATVAVGRDEVMLAVQTAIREEMKPRDVFSSESRHGGSSEGG